MIEEQELTTDKDYLQDLYSNLENLVEYCEESKGQIQDMDNWEAVHDLEFQVKLAFEKFRRYLAKMGIEE